MKNYRVQVTSFIIIEAETAEDAKREFEASKERMVNNDPNDYEVEHDLLLNAEVDGVPRVEEQDEE